MLCAILVTVVFAQGPPTSSAERTAVVASTPADSGARSRRRRLQVTAAAIASAFDSKATRELFERARRKRVAHDSSLVSYDAKVWQRVSVSGAIGRLGPDRLIFRQESAARVRWQRGVGVDIEMLGARVAAPVLGSEKLEREQLRENVTGRDMSPIPYFPGNETLWMGGEMAEPDGNARGIVNPLTDGAEAYYTYHRGDSVRFWLPDGKMIQLQELQVRPRAQRSNVTVGSLWFDVASGHLVRAAYRLAAPVNMAIGAGNVDDEDKDSTKASRLETVIINSILSPSRAQITSVVVEYGLHDGRFWLPRLQRMDGVFEAAYARVPVKIENAFSYASVNADLALAPINVNPRALNPFAMPAGLDSAAQRRWRDSTRAAYRAAHKAREDSVKAGMNVGAMRQCDTSAVRVVTSYRHRRQVAVRVQAPCDLDKLIASPDLPRSIYDPGEEVFGSEEIERLAREALPMTAQARLALALLPKPTWLYGLALTRYNRVEGFSMAMGVEQQLGRGFVVGALGRYSLADARGSAELTVSRTNMTRTMRAAAYKRVVAVNDWGNPLSFGSSLSAFLFGRDEGFYYRATGAELLWTRETGPRVEWRAFAERQRNAEPNTSFSVAGSFMPNIDISTTSSRGVAARLVHGVGEDPRALRTLADARLEAATGDATYARGAADVTLSRSVTRRIAAALTLGAGASAGQLPIYRHWFLGGTHTIRGQSPDTTQHGTAYWMSRGEVATGLPGVRVALFGDLGWTGDRSSFSDVGRPMSGVGIGLSALDGLLRFDVARGVYPQEQTRLNVYVGARF